MSGARLFRAYRPGDRKRYFRGGGLRTSGVNVPAPEFRIEDLIAEVRNAERGTRSTEWEARRVGAGWRVYFASVEGERLMERLRQLEGERVLEVCCSHGGTGCRLLSVAFSRVRWQGKVVEFYQGEVSSPLSVVSSGSAQ